MMNSLHENKKKSKFKKLDLQKVIQATSAVRHNNGTETYWMGHCPVHDDKDPSCKITGEPHDAKVHCFAGCPWQAVRDTLLARGCAAFDADGLDDTPARDSAQKSVITDQYDYKDEKGNLLYQVLRYTPKDFRQRRPDGAGGWIWNLKDVRRVLYHLPELIKSNKKTPIIWTEGEKDVENLRRLSFTATTAAQGVNGFKAVADHAREVLAGGKIILLPDNDAPGREYILTVARALHGVAEGIWVVDLPGLPPKGDVSDWIEARRAEGMDDAAIAKALRDIVNKTPPWQPAADADTTDTAETTQAETKPICLADIQPVPVSWLWEGRIARGKITLIAGNPGLGKSFLALDLAARVSTGAKFPDGTPGCPGKALLLSAEDDLADTIRPRLDAAGGDCTNILARRYGDLGNLESQLPQLEADLKDTKPALLIVDPITAFLGRLDAHRNDEIRSLFARLTELAARYNVAVVVVSHLNKSTSQSAALHRVSGSLGFVAAARAAYLVERDPENPDDRLFLPLKNNLGDDQTGFRFRLDGEPGSTPRVEWDADPVTITADELLAQKTGKEPTAQADAERWLCDVLADGPMESDRIKRMALRDGYSWRTIRRAQKNLGIKPKKSGFENGWTWTLPEDGQLDDIWPPSGNHNEDGQTTPKMAKLNEHETWPPSMNLATFDESNPDACEDGQTDKTWPPSMDEPPSENPSPTVEEEF